ncbi:MAG: HIT family protein [Rhodospirillales bacterium]
MFELHPDLVAGTFDVASLPLCRVQLLNDKTYPWLVLVPAKPGLKDFHDIAASDQLTLMQEIDLASRALVSIYNPDKMNVAALGNMTPQLHIHVIARYKNDPAWPGPVWGAVAAKKYGEAELAQMIEKIQAALKAVG